MKYNLRNILPPSDEELRRFEQALNEPQDSPPPEKGFVKLMEAVEAGRHLERYRKGSEQPGSVAVLAQQVSRACSLSQREMASIASVNADTWEAVIAGEREPTRIPVESYARLARKFGLSFDLLKQAILGSYTALLKKNINGHVRFARSSTSSRKKEDYAKSLAVSFEELRTKSKAYRESLAGNEEIDKFLKELRACLI